MAASKNLKITLKNGDTQKQSSRGLTCNFIKKETLAQVFSCEFGETFKNTFSYRTPPVAASVYSGLEETISGLGVPILWISFELYMFSNEDKMELRILLTYYKMCWRHPFAFIVLLRKVLTHY